MKLIAYMKHDGPPRIRAAPLERDWMDATSKRYAYRCLPLNIANAHGWEILCPTRVRAEWSGGPELEALKVECDAPYDLQPVSHFGSGILTFHLDCLLRTEPGIDLWVTGPPNRAKDGIVPLTGVVEADWSPFSFTMNWRFTAPCEVVFEEGEPYCFFFPVQRSLLGQTEPEWRCLADDPALEAEFNAWKKSRYAFNKDMRVPGSQASEQGWQRHYFRGLAPSGAAAEEHRSRLRLPPFVKS